MSFGCAGAKNLCYLVGAKNDQLITAVTIRSLSLWTEGQRALSGLIDSFGSREIHPARLLDLNRSHFSTNGNEAEGCAGAKVAGGGRSTIG